jgi:death-on-curing protein
MIKFNKEKVLSLHKLLIDEMGGKAGVLNMGALDSALNQCFHIFEGVELYPTKIGKGAWLCHSLISNHVFVDGNKRIGIYVMLCFLEVNGIHITATDEELINLAESIAYNNMKYADVLNWLKQRA